ncbi:p24 complex component [Sorochytrium milnesiophthora]
MPLPHAATTALLLLLVFVLSSLVHDATAFTIRLPPHQQQCFFEPLKVDQTLAISYQVGYGGKMDADFWVSDPENKILKMIQRQSTGTYEFTAAKEGRYTYCFSNQMSTSTEKIIQFSTVGADHIQVFDPKVKLDPVQKAINELASNVHAIKEEQQYIVTRERAHRNTAESTNARVVWWSLFQTALLVAVCLFQVYFLKHFFEVKRVV